MNGVLEAFSIEMLRSGIRLGTPIILAAIGAVICNRAGVLNLALEGMMLLGAFLGILVGSAIGSAAVGVLASAVAGGALGGLFALLYLRFKIDLVILAIAINLFISEMTVFFMRSYLGDTPTISAPNMQQLPDLTIPLLDQVPVLGPLLSGHNGIVYFSWLASVLAFYMLFRTKFGRHIRAVGESKGAAASAGIHVARVQVFALVISGVLAGIAGAFLSVGHLTLFTRNMSNGRGWIGLTAAIFGFNHPIAVLFIGLFFGVTDALAVRLQTTTTIPPSLVQFMPQVFTLLALIGVAVRVRLSERLARRSARWRSSRPGRAQVGTP